MVFPATPPVALILNILVSTLPVIAIAAITLRFFGPLAAILAGLWYTSLPMVIWSGQYFLLDQPVTAALLAASAAWVYFSKKPNALRALLVAALAGFAVLIKGNGWLIALFPLLHIAFTGQWKLLANKYTYLGLAAALLLVTPWYVVTTGISADGFNFKPGLAYAWSALQANPVFALEAVGPVAILLALAGVWWSWSTRRDYSARWEAAASCLALIAATLLFQMIVPADLANRYVAPTLPALIVLAVFGLAACYAWMSSFSSNTARRGVLAVLIAGAAYPSLLYLAEPHAKPNLKLDIAAEEVVKDGSPEVWIIDGSTSAEGATIAEIAIRDPGKHIYVVRSSEFLAESDFMGRRYALKYSDPAAVLQAVKNLNAAGVILVTQPYQTGFEHSDQLRAGLGLPGSGFREIAEEPHVGDPGLTTIYRTLTPQTPNMRMLRQINFPAKAATLGATAE